VANRLLEEPGQTYPIHALTWWDEKEVKAVGGWDKYLEQKTGVAGELWLTHKAYLLLDEAQTTYWDRRLWTIFFKAIDASTCNPFVVLFSSYGSPGRGNAGFYEEMHNPTPMKFGPNMLISLRPDKHVNPSQLITTRPDGSIDVHTTRPVGLLLEVDEATDVMKRNAPVTGYRFLSADLESNLFLISDGHVGVLRAIIAVLPGVPKLCALMRKQTPLNLQTVREHLLGQPLTFFRELGNSPFTRGLPPVNILQNTVVARIFKRAIACDGIYQSDFMKENKESKATLEKIWRNGWLHADMSNNDVRYVFASTIHRWYCACLLEEVASDGVINYDVPLQLAVDAIKCFRPSQLLDPPRSSTCDTLPLEDQYQKEFYRCLYTILDGRVRVSPEFVVRKGSQGGIIDFFVASKKWGFELLRDRNRVGEHMARFEDGGQYFGMVQSGGMEQYVVLDFTVTKPAKRRPEYQRHLYHVLFTENYRQVEVIDASDLSTVDSFALTENDILYRTT
jgi:hypothetical protein